MFPDFPKIENYDWDASATGNRRILRQKINKTIEKCNNKHQNEVIHLAGKEGSIHGEIC